MYEPLYTQDFKKCIDKHKNRKKQLEKLINRILENPKHKSHLLDKRRGIDLRGKRSRHLTPNFVVIYIICDECINESFRSKGYNNCPFCEEKPIKRVVFLAFDKHQDIYSKEWAD